MINLDVINSKFNLSFPKDLVKFKKYVEESNSINQLKELTGMTKPYLEFLLNEYDLEVQTRCLYCGKKLQRASSGTNKKYCNNRCSYLHKAKDKPCVACGKVFKATKGIKYCSPECKSKGYSTTSNNCNWCGKQYVGHKSSKYCSDDCRIASFSSTADNTYKTCQACGKQYIGDCGCSWECRQQLACNRAKKLLIEVYGTYKKDEIRKGLINNGQKSIKNS